MTQFAIYLPFLAAIMWGASYALYEKALETVSITTWCVICGLSGIISAYILAALGLPKIDFKPLMNPQTAKIAFATVLFSTIGYFATLYAIKYVNATYAAMGEVSYPLFVPVFALLFFGTKEFSTSTMIGGTLIIIGSFILIRGKAGI